MSLPQTRCLNRDKLDCATCGPYMGWKDLSNPGRNPSFREWHDAETWLQKRHDIERQKEFDKLALVPME